jgi:cytochrome oxidase Cu insertion factor (SCO1/SenC/PrrC family)
MTGMGGSVGAHNSTIISAFKSALLHQGLVVLVIVALVALAWNVFRTVKYRRSVTPGVRPVPELVDDVAPEPSARHLLRVAFGCLWVFDGILQAQVSMPLGLPSGVLQPAGSSSPGWVQHLVNIGVTIWSNHPIPAAASAVWIQIGVGLWLLAAPRGNWSRFGGLASAGWGLIVWVFGEAFGGIFAPGLTWLFGAPGAAVFYVIAGVLVALPERSWSSPRLGRVVLVGMGVFFVGMSVLQAWPGRGFWQGQVDPHATAGTLTGMVQSMAGTPQPGFLSSWVAAFAAFDAAHGWAVNLVVVVVLAAIGTGFLTGRVRVVRIAAAAGVLLCLADWVLVEDLGFLGGVGTDPNSMIPMALVFVAGYLALTPAVVAVPAVPSTIATVGRVDWRDRLIARPAYVFRSLLALGAVGVVLLGAAPMALASTNPVADPILNQALDGTPNVTDSPAPPFSLVDQYGRSVSLKTLRGKTVALTFLDPVCTTDCPVIAQDFRMADHMLGTQSKNTEFVAIVANPLYNTEAVTRAFDRIEGLDGLSNWLYLTGSPSQLERVWDRYGILVAVEPAGAMVAHTELAFVIDAHGHTRFILDSDPGSGGTSLQSSFAGVIADKMRQTLGSP